MASESSTVCAVTGLRHQYGERLALDAVDLEVKAGEVVSLLGPNGSGKTTLFRLLSTLMPIQNGSISVDGIDVVSNPLAARGRIGIVFQSPSLDKKLTVDENLSCQAALYGIRGRQLELRRDEVLEQFGLSDRRRDLCETLSGGLKRRVELAKGMLHRPALLLLDEPSTGIDPGARLGLWSVLRELAASGTSVLLTTHILEEAEKSDRVAILHAGRKIADAAPSVLRMELAGDLVTIVTHSPETVEMRLRSELGIESQRIHDQIRFHCVEGASRVPQLAAMLGDDAQSIAIGRPGLEDVFIAKTGHAFEAK